MLRAPYIKTAVDQSSLPASCSLRRKDGGGERDRTDGLLVANQALSQLSYTPARQPIFASGPGVGRPRHARDAWWA